MPRPRHHHSGQRAADALVRIAPLVTRWVERLLALHDPPLTLAQYLVLDAARSEGVGGADLARRAAVSPAAVSQLLAALEEAELISRDRLGDDRRRQRLRLTDRGERVLRSTQTLLRERIASLVADIPPHESEPLARVLEHLAEALGAAPPPKRPPHTRPGRISPRRR